MLILVRQRGPLFEAIIRALKKDPTRNEEEALKEIYKRLRPGEPPTTANAKAIMPT